jgi:hypothetical protein
MERRVDVGPIKWNNGDVAVLYECRGDVVSLQLTARGKDSELDQLAMLSNVYLCEDVRIMATNCISALAYILLATCQKSFPTTRYLLVKPSMYSGDMQLSSKPIDSYHAL